MAEFFEDKTPRQKLAKAKREFQKLQTDLTSDNIYNFFVTAYHILDSVKVTLGVPDKTCRELCSHPDFKDLCLNSDFKKCRYICDKEKHIVLKRGDEFKTYRRPAAVFGQVGFNEAPYNAKPAYFVIDNNEQVDALELGQRIIDLWENFFVKHNI